MRQQISSNNSSECIQVIVAWMHILSINLTRIVLRAKIFWFMSSKSNQRRKEQNERPQK